jgi:hypothetical protein
LKPRLILALRISLVIPLLFGASLCPATAQSTDYRAMHSFTEKASPVADLGGALQPGDSDWSGLAWASSSAAAMAGGDAAASLPSAPGFEAEPEPGVGGGYDHYAVAPAAYWHQAPFSRIGIGADISPLGVGIKSAIVLNQNFDARVVGNYFSYPNAKFDIDGFNINGNIHMASAAASLDWYPFGSIFRLSPGVMFYNGNQVSATGGISGGTSFTLGAQTYYAARSNPATGATPLTGTGLLGLHTHTPALTVAGGFGSFVPRSNRHWSFPSEFGVVFMGAPTVNVNLSGWACTDAQETQCTNVADPKNPIAIQFNENLQTRIQKWRHDLDVVKVYPIFSYSVVYSFNIR